MDEKSQSVPELDASLLEKMDGGLRRFLFDDEETICAAIEEDAIRFNEIVKWVEGIDKLIPAAGTAQDRMHIERIKALNYARMAPNVLYGPVIVDKSKIKPIKIRALIKFAGNRDDLIAMGLDVGLQAQDIFTVTGTKMQLAQLASQTATVRICLPRPMAPDVGQAGKQAEIDQVHAPLPNTPNGFEGKGVIVGIVDTALDITHNAFREPSGNHGSRILYYWVQQPDSQSAPGKTPEESDPIFLGLKRGRLYTQADIDKALSLGGAAYGDGKDQISKKPKPYEHGTHVAGIAAGNGYDANWKKGPNVGAAPKADIIHVCRFFAPNLPDDYPWDSAFEDSALEAINFIFRAAEKEKKPVVINLSEGCQLGPHNGSTLFDQARDNLVNSYKDRSIVCSAGNANDGEIFIKGEIPAGGEKSLELKVKISSTSTATVLEVWHTGPELDFKFKHMEIETIWYEGGQSYHHNQGLINYHTVDVTRTTDGNMRNIRFQIVLPTSLAKHSDKVSQPWTISLRNASNAAEANFYAWVGPFAGQGTLTGGLSNELTLMDTACAKSVITVGACEKYIPPNPAVGEKIALYSGAGPTLDGRTKPEIVAVGGNDQFPVISAASDQTSGYYGSWGTSMSAPLVTGSVALLFEEYYLTKKQGKLENHDIKALLVQTANRKGLHLDPMDSEYTAQHRNQYGYGRLRMLAPINHSPPLVDVDVWIRTAEDDYGVEPFLGDVYWQSPDIHVRKPQSTKDLSQVRWGDTYSVIIRMHNLGIDHAVDCELSLKYTIPFTARSEWTPAKNSLGDIAKSKKFTIPALNHFVITFEWKPDKADFNSPPTNETHFCLLAEIVSPIDDFSKKLVGGQGVDPWERNIKGINNIALRNISIYE